MLTLKSTCVAVYIYDKKLFIGINEMNRYDEVNAAFQEILLNRHMENRRSEFLNDTRIKYLDAFYSTQYQEDYVST